MNSIAPIKRLTFFADGGHGWLRVPLKSLPTFVLAKVSACSYVSHSRRYIYLEEDCDARHALDYFKGMGVDTRIGYVYGKGNRLSSIRFLPGFNAREFLSSTMDHFATTLTG